MEASPDPMEQEDRSSEISTDSDPVRCFPLRMGAMCNGVSTGGLWFPQDQLLHTNCLELLAADLALKSFLKDQHEVAVLLQLDNSTAVAYVNNLPSAHSLGENKGPGEGHHNYSPTHPRYVQHCSRLQVQGQIRLDVGSSSIPQDEQYSGAPRD